ncbi:GxxExxY protein [Bacteroidia bacterium]|nr:GxxExxY protein [Bacteroidia bacterium]MDB4107360.1 GxxExxY protein [Bacteroidia bacterium]MDB9883094.1 GxxExxY protein [Bacteroidia bacterium]
MQEENKIATQIIGAAIDVHRELGPGLLESAYASCLTMELRERGLFVEKEKSLPVIYKGNEIDCSYRIDLLVENLVVIELKAVGLVMPIHQAQTLKYLKLSGKKLGLILNFNETLLKDGISRIIHRK